MQPTNILKQKNKGERGYFGVSSVYILRAFFQSHF